MPDKYLVEFLAQWVRDEDLRCKVLYQEQTSLQAWGLDAAQIADLLSLDEDTILARIAQELKADFGVDLATLSQEVFGGGGGGGGGGGAAAIYGQGQAHVRRTEPGELAKDLESVVIVLGQGFDPAVVVHFVKGTKKIQGTVLGIECDADVYQRITVKVKLDDKGAWTVRAQNAGEPESTEPTSVTVV